MVCRTRHLYAFVVALGLAAGPSVAGAAGRYLYNVSDFNGEIPSSWAALHYDRQHRELYAVHDARVTIFNELGMEIFSFPGAPQYGYPVAAVSVENGDILVLSQLGMQGALTRYTFRGEPVGRFEVVDESGAPVSLSADAIEYANGRVYLASRGGLEVLVADTQGRLLARHDLLPLVKVDPKKIADAAMKGFAVDDAGNLHFTVPALFQAFVVSADGKVTAFGQRGSTPGKFNIVGAIARDEQGRCLVIDVLRAGIMIFDDKLQLVEEFAGRGFEPGLLIAPYDMAVGGGKVFVSQSANRGVSVFRYD